MHWCACGLFGLTLRFMCRPMQCCNQHDLLAVPLC